MGLCFICPQCQMWCSVDVCNNRIIRVGGKRRYTLSARLAPLHSFRQVTTNVTRQSLIPNRLVGPPLHSFGLSRVTLGSNTLPRNVSSYLSTHAKGRQAITYSASAVTRLARG
ncbi:hypothetical protein BHE74_00000388 [Ensete ventricosum]|nr:hypothetical protein BHE74_00000388 [Ensete ventricosum]